MIDQINNAQFHYSQGCNERLLHIVDYFLTKGIDVNAKDEWGETALMAACRNLNIDVVRLLLENGANVDSECFINIFTEWYSEWDEKIQIQIELSKLLLKKNIDVNIKHNGQTALMYIVQYNSKFELKKQTELLQLILDSGADIDATDDDGKTALMLAIEAKNKYVAGYLLQQDAYVNIKDNAGNTALTYAQKALSEYYLKITQ